MMGKDPAFLFYPNDYIGGTMGMTFEEKGAYMELLILQFNRGHMTSHMIGQTVGQLWVNLEDKFKQDDEGLWFNERLDIEKERRQKYVKSRANNKKGVNQYTKNRGHMNGHMTPHTVGHMENENRNRNRSVVKGCTTNPKPRVPDRPEPGITAKVFDDLIPEAQSMAADRYLLDQFKGAFKALHGKRYLPGQWDLSTFKRLVDAADGDHKAIEEKIEEYFRMARNHTVQDFGKAISGMNGVRKITELEAAFIEAAHELREDGEL